MLDWESIYRDLLDGRSFRPLQPEISNQYSVGFVVVMVEHTLGQIHKCLDKIIGRLGLQSGGQRIGGSSEQEFSGRIHRQAEEEILKVHGRAVARD